MRVVSILVCLLFATCLAKAEEDPILMYIAGEPVLRSEFEYNYNKNNSDEVIDKRSLTEYLELFINYRLKVQAGIDAKMDTTRSFIEEFATYRDAQIKPLLVQSSRMDEECLQYYQHMKANLQGKPLILPAHIFMRVPQQADATTQQRIKEKIDSVYQCLLAGEDFAELAKQYSEDSQTAPLGGVIAWIGPNQTLPEFEQVAYSLKKDEISEPFLSTVGYHILYLQDIKELESYEELYPRIVSYLESRGLRNRLAEMVIDSIAQKNVGKSIEQIIQDETNRLCAEDSNLKYLIKEYHDGLILYNWCNQNIWEPASKDTVGIERYFKKNKKKYTWKKPKFNGLVFYCKQEEDVDRVKTLLKKSNPDEWLTLIKKNFNKDEIRVRSEKRLFSQGENRYVDYLAGFSKKQPIKPKDGFIFTGIMGEKLKKGPKRWTDVSAQVILDYQRYCEDMKVKDLRSRYKVSIDEEVLKTVNKH